MTYRSLTRGGCHAANGVVPRGFGMTYYIIRYWVMKHWVNVSCLDTLHISVIYKTLLISLAWQLLKSTFTEVAEHPASHFRRNVTEMGHSFYSHATNFYSLL